MTQNEVNEAIEQHRIWNKSRFEGGGQGKKFAIDVEKFENIDFTGKNLSNVSLMYCEFVGCKFDKSIAYGADFSGSNFFTCSFKELTYGECDLFDCEFRECDFELCNFSCCNLRSSLWKDVWLEAVGFGCSNLNSARFIPYRADQEILDMMVATTAADVAQERTAANYFKQLELRKAGK